MSDVSEKVLSAGTKKIPRERIEMAARLFLAGKSRSRVVEAICEKFKVTSRTGRRYLAIVERRLAALPKPPPEATFHRVEEMLLETYDLARSGVKRMVVPQGAGMPSEVEEFPEANVGVMANVATRLADLYGVTAPRKVDITSAGDRLALTIYAPEEREP